MLSQLSSNDKLALAAAILVEMTSLLALGDGWGMIMIVTFLASLGAIAVLVLPWLAPERKLPAPKGLSLVALGAAAILGTGISTLQNMSFIAEEIADFETLIFLGGMVAAVALAYAGLMAYRAEGGSAGATAAPTAPPAAPPAS